VIYLFIDGRGSHINALSLPSLFIEPFCTTTIVVFDKDERTVNRKTTG
jgi:hypothetical protein